MAFDINRSSLALPSAISSEIMAKVAEDSAVMKLAKRIELPGNGVTIPVITGDPTAEFVGETDPKPVDEPELTTKLMSAYKIATIVPLSNEFRRDAAALYEEIVRRIPSALGRTFDAAVFGLINKPGDNWDSFASCTAQSLTPTTGHTVYDGLVAADADIAMHDGVLNGFALGPKAKAVLLSTTDGNGRPLFINSVAEGAIPQILGAPTYITKAAQGTGEGLDIVGFAGDWSQALYGTVEGVKIDLSDQATLTKGNKTINLFQDNMFAVRAEIEVGFRADTSVFNKFVVTSDESE